MATISNRQPSIKIEYTSRNSRVTKEFGGDQIAAAKHLFFAKESAGKAPKVLAGTLEPEKALAPAVGIEEAPAAAPVAAKASKPRKSDTGATPTPAPTVASEPIAEEKPTRPRVAGRVLAKLGLGVGVTAEMVALVDQLFGAKNEPESRGRLRNAREAIRGWCEQMGIDPNTGRKLPAAK